MKIVECAEDLKLCDQVADDIDTYLESDLEANEMKYYSDVESLLSDAYKLINNYEKVLNILLDSVDIKDLIGKGK